MPTFWLSDSPCHSRSQHADQIARASLIGTLLHVEVLVFSSVNRTCCGIIGGSIWSFRLALGSLPFA